MSERTALTGDGAWHNVGTGPATAQNLSDQVPVMFVCSGTQPTGSDGIVLINQGDSHTFQLTQTIWAQVIRSGATAIVAVQPE